MSEKSLTEEERGYLRRLIQRELETTRFPLSAEMRALRSALAKLEEEAEIAGPAPKGKRRGR
jgi:hypothetical protein